MKSDDVAVGFTVLGVHFIHYWLVNCDLQHAR